MPGRQDSNLGMAESKSNDFRLSINEHSEKSGECDVMALMLGEYSRTPPVGEISEPTAGVSTSLSRGVPSAPMVRGQSIGAMPNEEDHGREFAPHEEDLLSTTCEATVGFSNGVPRKLFRRRFLCALKPLANSSSQCGNLIRLSQNEKFRIRIKRFHISGGKHDRKIGAPRNGSPS